MVHSAAKVILMIIRARALSGMGTWALPAGQGPHLSSFVYPYERILTKMAMSQALSVWCLTCEICGPVCCDPGQCG